jgi:O-antigen/teichoic acid export membrane protein
LVEATPASEDRAKNITRGVASLAAQNIGTSILAYILLAFLTRLLGATFGIYYAVLTVVGIAGAVSVFGFSAASTRYVAYLRQSDVSKSWAAARSTLVLSLVFSVVVTAAYSFLTPYFSLYFTQSTQWTSVFLLGGLWLFSLSLSTVVQGIIQGLKRYLFLAKILFVSRFVMVGFSIVVLLFVYDNVAIPVIAWAIYYSLVIVFSFRIVFRGLGTAKKQRYPYSDIIKYSLPLGVAAIIQTVASTADPLVVGGYLGTFSLGVYGVILSISSVLGVVLLGPLTTTFFPEASSASGTEMSNAFRLAMRFVMLSTLPASFMIAALAPQLITLFAGKASYLVGVGPLDIIAFLYVFAALYSVAVFLLQAVGKTTQVLVAGAVTAAVDVGLSLLLVPMFGLDGAAVSRVAVALIGTFVGLYYSRKYLGSFDSAKFYLKCLVCAVVPFSASYVLTTYVSSGLLTLVPYGIISILLFIACLKGLRVLTEQDKGFISHLLPSFAKGILKHI